MNRSVDPSPTRIVVAICTHQRNEALRRLLEALIENDALLGESTTVGLSLADDNVDGRARSVFDEYAPKLSGASRYANTGSGNISVARNAALENALEIADWVAMTDDDCLPVPTWLSAYLEVQQATNADVVTGPCELEPPTSAPGWITAEPFLELARLRLADRSESDVAATNNSFMRAEFFGGDDGLRFDPTLGVVGGEDMVFFKSAKRAGANIRFSTDAVVMGHEAQSRMTFRYQLRAHCWLGNSEFVTHDYFGDVNRPRWAARGAKLVLEGIARPVVRLASRRRPQLRYSSALVAQGLGRILGAAGVRLKHH